MAKSPTPVRNAWRGLIWLAVITVGLVALNIVGVLWANGTWAPKLALDLEGGTEMILAPKLESGQTISEQELNQAVAIIRQRIDAAGVSESEINTQGSSNIVVSIPGIPDEETKKRIESSARLDFRPVLVAGAPTNEVIGADGKATPAPSPDPNLPSTPSTSPTDGSDLAWVTPMLKAQFDAFSCSSDEATETNVAPEDEPLITCDDQGTVKYILGPVEVEGKNITDATSGLTQSSAGVTTNTWAVSITFNSKGAEAFDDISSRLISLPEPRNQFAAVLDGKVITAPRVLGITGQPQITGDFTQESAKSLADQLKFGALPISFQLQSSNTITATLGTSQLQSGLIAGLIGLLLVVVYTLFQYRLLGFVTIASLVVAAIVTYLVVTIMSWREGYRLSLAGIAGLIVAIGFTADSFIVYFERIRDELREGRGLVAAVEVGWKRAKRTIYAAKAVNLLSAVVLFVLAVGSVRGFAFTLGITTIIDVVVVLLFTHPMLQLLANTKFFSSGHPASGLDPNALGAVYRGRGQFRTPSERAKASKVASSSREATKRQTIAERKAAELERGDGDLVGSGKGEGKDR